MGLYHMGPPARLARLLKNELDIDLFVETGTYLGNTANWAAGCFKEVVTVEASPSYAEKARIRFAGTNVRVVEGSSASVLPTALSACSANAMFWLDAHWCGGKTAGSGSECPFFEEMKVINARKADDVVLLDDARLFSAPPPAPHDPTQWPTLTETVSSLEAGGRRYVMIIDDIFVAVPISKKDFLVAQSRMELTRRAKRMLYVAKISRLLGAHW
jgi:hypothetical protein